jgi:hypothetical protein
MPSKKLIPGVDFAPPEPIASVLPRVQLKGAQTDELWALTQKGPKRAPNETQYFLRRVRLRKRLNGRSNSTFATHRFGSISLRSVVVLRHSAMKLSGFSRSCPRNTIRWAIFSS